MINGQAHWDDNYKYDLSSDYKPKVNEPSVIQLLKAWSELRDLYTSQGLDSKLPTPKEVTDYIRNVNKEQP